MKKLPVKVIIVLFISVLTIGCKKDKIQEPPIAIADNSEITQLPKDSITLTGTGKSTNGNIVGYLWSQVTGPNIASIVSPGAATTTIRNLRTGKYVFQFAVIDDAGLTGVDTVSVTVTPSPIITVTLQPSNNYNETHILGNLNGLDFSSNIAVEFGGATWTYLGEPFSMRAAFNFDLTGIPSDATITSAKLTLYSNPTPLNGDHVNANSGSDNSLLLQRIIASWDASKTNWTNQPQTTTSGQIEFPSTTQPFLDLTDIDVTQLVGSMISNNARYGFFLKLKNESMYTCRIFCSSKYSDASKHPKLVVTYKIN